MPAGMGRGGELHNGPTKNYAAAVGTGDTRCADDELDQSSLRRTPCSSLSAATATVLAFSSPRSLRVYDPRILWAGWRAGALKARPGNRGIYRVEIRTDAGPWSAVQCFASGGPYTTASQGSAMPGGVSAAAVAEAGDVADEDLLGPSGWPLGQRIPPG